MGMPETWAFSELFGFEEELLQFIPTPVLAVIVNMERLKKEEDKNNGSLDTEIDYYMKQTATLDNACGVIACIQAIFNNLGENKIHLIEGQPLKNFYNSVKDKDPAERASILEGFTEFQE